MDFAPDLDFDTQYRIMRVQLALETGWTFDHIDNLSVADFGDVIGFLDGKGKAAERE